LKFNKCYNLFFWRNQKNITFEEVIIITASKEIEILSHSVENYHFDKTIFFALAVPLLLVVSFLTLHLAEIFQLQGLITMILISSYILLLYPICKISISKINKQNRDLMKLREMIIVDYKTCKFCGKQLSIKEFYDTNKKADLQKISIIWNSSFYGLLCCTCFESTPPKFWIKLKEIKKIKNYFL
jgi:hypothetical protein